MKIVRINAVYGIRSTGGFVKEIHEWALNEGHQSYVFAAEVPKQFSNVENVFRIGTTLDHKKHALLSRVTGLQAYFSDGATNELIKKIDEISPDVVHLHNLHSNYINLNFLLEYLAKKDVATVLTLHDCWFYTGKCTHYTSAGCENWKLSCGGCPRLKVDNVSWFFDNTERMLSDKKKLFGAIPRLGVIGVSDWIANEAKKSILGSARVIRRIYNWVDDELIAEDGEAVRKDLGLNKSSKTVLFVASSWGESKGSEDLIWLIPKLEKHGFNVIVVGNADQEEIRRGNHIWIKETHDKRYLASLYRLSDVFVNLSREETFGRVSAEAGLNNCRVISYYGTANDEIVKEFGGVLCDDRDEIIAAALSILEDLVEDNARRKTVRRDDQFQKEKCIAEYMSVYNQLMLKTPAPLR
ncbi:glycosyltransferase [Aeromonas caviae]|uniref:glycosyltransferase n=1 Tax=Aeromonas caviae TaxID=648 RepID=UPI0024479EDF|nr:glycosyltransferase [Aeromonas caviae]MDH0238989.1 glycosyltransferase [Aeromonas caviae]